MFYELNKDQLDGLAKLCFDLARGSLGISLLPPLTISIENPSMLTGRVILGLSIGIAFTYAALVILKIKEKAQ